MTAFDEELSRYVEIGELVYAKPILPAAEFKEAVIDIVTRQHPPTAFGGPPETTAAIDTFLSDAEEAA